MAWPGRHVPGTMVENAIADDAPIPNLMSTIFISVDALFLKVASASPGLLHDGLNISCRPIIRDHHKGWD